jgi:hypothetical protein
MNSELCVDVQTNDPIDSMNWVNSDTISVLDLSSKDILSIGGFLPILLSLAAKPIKQSRNCLYSFSLLKKPLGKLCASNSALNLSI